KTERQGKKPEGEHKGASHRQSGHGNLWLYLAPVRLKPRQRAGSASYLKDLSRSGRRCMAYHRGNGRVLDRSVAVGAGPNEGSPSLVSILPSRRSQESASANARSACPELACLVDRLPPAVLAWAERQATKVGVSAERGLIAAEHISEEAYLEALARSLGFQFETF